MNKIKEINKFLKDNIKANDTLILACSGGPDSMCLLDLLLKFREKNNINIVIAHVHHNVRKESDDELVFVRDYAVNHDVIFETMKIENYSGSNFECEARDKRYTYFSKLIEKYNAKYLLTAHHGDDLMETILMRIVRGSNLKGYSGFDRVSNQGDYKVLRPLIALTKSEILDYNKENNIPYVNDYTNELDVHTRNRYRKYILPKLKEEDSNVNLKFLKFSEVLKEYDEYIEKEVLKIINKVYVNNILDISKFIKLDSLIQTRVISKILSNIYKDNIVYLDDKNILSIKKLILSDASNSSLNLPKGKVAIKSYNNFYINDNKDSESYCYTFKDNVTLPNGKIIEKIDNTSSNSNYVCRLSSKDIKLPIIIRSRKDGDMIEVMNLNGRKKVKDIFIDAKVSMRDRKSWPIVTDSDGNILWIPGIKKSKYNKQINEKCDIILTYH
nr:tRNA lysidine(34) synthetase TilS [Bacilli bacterium]